MDGKVYAVAQILFSIFASHSCVARYKAIVTAGMAELGWYDFAILVEVEVWHSFIVVF